MKSFSSALSYTFKIWSCFLILFLLPMDLLRRIDSFLKQVPFKDIFFVSAEMVIFLLIVSFCIAVIAGCAVLLFSVFSRNKIISAVYFINNILILLFTLNVFIFISNIWSTKLLKLKFAVSTDLLTLYVFICMILISYLFRKKIDFAALNHRFSGKVNAFFKPVVIISVISIIVFTYDHTAALISRSGSETAINNLPKNSNKLPNIILITFDAMSAEDMSLYGYNLETTPNINEFAKESFVFDYAYANCNFTAPSIISILTGKYPLHHKGISTFYAFLSDGKRHENIANIFQHNGYQTSAFVANEVAYPLTNGLYKYFDKNKFSGSSVRLNPIMSLYDHLAKTIPVNNLKIYFWVKDIDTYFMNNLLKRILFYILPHRKAKHIYFRAGLTFNEADKFLMTSESPFFQWIHIFEPHGFYLPPKKFKYRFLPEKILDTLNSQRDIYEHSVYPHQQQPVIDKLRLRYDEFVLYADHEFGNFLQILKQKGYYDNSIIIVSSDHGESFEDGYVTHAGPYLYQQLIRIPLIIHLPGQKTGKRIYGNAEQVDIAPTMLDLLGMDIPKWMDGESLKEAMQGNYTSKKLKFSMTFEENGIKEPVSEGTITVIQDRYKYIYYIKESRGELFNIEKDPKEDNNLSDVNMKRSESMKKLILERIRR